MKKGNLSVIVVLVLVYGLLIFVFYPKVGDVVGIFSVVPIIVSAWYYGRKGGVITALIVSLIGVLFTLFTDIIPNEQNIMFIARSLAGLGVGYIVGLATDNTDKFKQLENETIALKLGILRSKDVIFITDSEGVFNFINPAFTDTYGYNFEEIKGKTPRILKSGFRDDKFYADFWKKIKNGQSLKIEMRNMTKNGRMLEIDSSVNPVINNFGQIIGFLAIQRNVTEKKRIEEDMFKRTVELEKLNRIMVDRELKMVELKKQIQNKQTNQ